MSVTVPNLIAQGQRVWASVDGSAPKIGPIGFRLSNSLEVIGTDAVRSSICYYLSVVHNNCMGILFPK